MPLEVLFFMTSLISSTSPFLINVAIMGEASKISTAATRPLPFALGSRRCDTKARKLSDKSSKIWLRRLSGKKLMIRSRAWLVLLACKVAIQKCPVSAKSITSSIVWRSRNSPNTMTSGAWRMLLRKPLSHVSVSSPTSRCVTMQFLCGCTNSTGSSMVTMWPKE